ncbi:PAS domain S-box protein [Tolypothrix sp. FACHB-123]|uniref:PAS domain S-box protein n=1 Tax=Tolypothrix sp. FACHB-123 TaxID=2692868 RepID=UPI001F5533D6|nr:PAS domain S-box protein [Tolypothrix sp. FACHB-123]
MSHISCLTVLLIDDCTVDRMKLRRLLKEDSRYTYRILEFSCAREAKQWCQQETPDVILLDFSLPDDNGLELLQELRVTLNNTQSAVIMLTGQGDEVIAVQAMKNGAQDYIVKDKLTPEVLNSAIHYGFERLQLARQLEQSREQQQLIAAIALRIRQSLNLEEILRVTAQEVRQFLGADRVIVYEFQPDMSGTIVAESVVPGWTVTLGKQIQDTWFPQQQVASAYQQGKKLAIDDIYQAGLTNCHLQLLEQFEVKANLVVPIVVADRLWGLLVAHQCSASRQWQTVELDLLEQLAVQIAIAIQQASAYEQLQAQLQERQRTEAALRVSEAKLKLTLNLTHIGYWEWNPSCNEIFLSENTISYFDYTRSDFKLTFEQHLSLIYPDDRQLVAREFSQAIATQTDYAVEYRVMWQDGSIHWLGEKGKGVYDESGQLLRMLGVLMDISERKQAEENLRASEERFRNTFEQAAVGMSHVSLAGKFIRVNQRFCEIIGYQAAELENLTFQEITHPQDLSVDLAQTEKLLAGEIATFSLEKRYIHKDNSPIWINLTVSLVRDRLGKPDYFISVVEDITQRRQTEAALRQNEERLHLALESAGMGNWDWNILTGEVHWSANLERIFGLTPGSFNGKYETVVAMIYPGDRYMVLQAINRAVYEKQDYHIEFRFVKLDGSLRWALSKGKVFYNEHGNPTRMMGIDLDITERKQTEAYLGESEERFRNIADTAPVLIWISGLNALCHYFNKTWLNFTGRTLEQELGDGWLQGVHPDDFQHCLNTYIDAFKARQNFRMEYRLRRYDGEYRWILDTGVARFTHDGEFLGYMGSCIDITERILAEQALQQLNHELEARVEQRTAALKESEERWHLAVRGSNDGIWDWNIKTNEIFLSARWQEMRGFAEHEIHYNIEQWLNQIHPEDRDRVLTALSDHLEHKSPLFCEEYRFKCKDGSYIWVLDRGQALWDETGKAIRLAGSGTDITERKVAEAQLLSITRLQQAILACSDYGIITLNLEGIIQTFNPAAQKMLGYTADEVVGRLTPMVFHDPQELQQRAAAVSWQLGREIPPNLELLTAISQQQQNYEQEWTYIHKDGSRLPVLLSITDLRDANGQIMGLLGIAKDITQQKQMAAKLRQNTAHLNLAQRIAHLGSWEFDFTSQNITWSEEVFRIFRRDPASGAPSYEELRELIHPEDRPVHDLLVQQTFKYGLSYKDEYRAYRTDGAIIHLLSRGEVIFDENGRPSRLIGTVMDITERKQAEIALRVSQERLQLALEGSGDGLWDWNLSTGEVYLSPNWVNMLGYEENELDNDVSTWESLIHPEDKPWVMDLLNAHLQNINAPYAFDYRLLTKSGEWKWIANYGKVVARDRNNAPVRMVGTHKDISDRKHIEEQLHSLSNRLTLALQSGAIATWDWDLIHDRLYWDERMYELYGMQTSQLPVKYHHWVNAVHLEDIAQAEASVQAALRGEKEFATEFRVIHPDSTIHFIKAAAIVQRDERGNPTRMVGINYDITERKQIEQALRESERRYATLAEASPVAIFRFDVNGNCIYVNDRWSEMTGRPIEAAMGMGWLNALHPDDREQIIHEGKKAVAEKRGKNSEGRHLHPDGTITWFYSQMLPEIDVNGNLIGYIGTLTDITSRKQIEQALQESERRYATLAEASPVAIFRFDTYGNCVYVNDRWSEMTGRPIEAAIGMGWLDTLHPDDCDRLVKDWSYACEHKVIYQNEGRCLRPDGSIIWFYIQSLPETDPNNQTIGYIGTLTDITSRKLIEEELVRQKELQEVIFNESTDALFLVDPQTLLTLDCNLRALEMYEVAEKSELIGIEGRTLQRHPFTVAELDDIVVQMQLKGFWSREIEYVTRKGKFFWGNIAAKQITVAGRNLNLVRVTDISDRKESEQVLAIYTRELADLYNNAPCGYHSLDADGRFVNINHTELQWLGYTYQEIIGKEFTDFITETSRSVFRQQFPKFKQRGWVKDLEFEMVCQDGTILPVLLNATAVKSEDGTYLFSRSSIFDIRDRKQAEQAIMQYAREVEDLYNNAPCGYHSLDSEGCFIKVNETELQWLGYKREEILGQPLVNFLTESSRLAFVQNYPLFKERGWVKDLEYDMICQDGSILPVTINATAVKDADGNYLYNRATLFDISDARRQAAQRKQAQKELEESRSMLRLILDTIPQRVFWKDRNSRFLGCNPGFANDYQLKPGEIIGKTDAELPWAQWAHLYRADDLTVIESRTAKLGYEEPTNNVNGEQIWLRTSKVPLTNSAGEIIGILGSYEDITDRKQAEEQLRRTNEQLARATRLKDEFLANMSHELRTPLNAILGMSEGFQEGVFGAINQRQAKAIATIERSGKHLLELINDILDLSKIESGKMELQLSEVSVSSLCDASMAFIKQMALKKNISLNTSIANNIASIQVDDRRLRQVLINLLSNAVKFTPDGGSVTLEVKLETLGEEIVNPLFYNASWKSSLPEPKSKADPNICFRIIDTGIGIAPENISKLFQPFVQLDSSLNRQYSGTGLGLALVERIATLHGGTVSVDSEVGKGSCFNICIPYKPGIMSPIAQIIAPLPSCRLAVANSPVLIIEDSVPAAEQITRYLTEMEMQPIVYAQGEGVIDEVLRVQPVMIFLDIQLPNISGWDVLNQLKANPKTKDIPVIIISVVDERTKGMVNGACEYLVKPVTRAQFQSTIEKVQHLILPNLSAGMKENLTDATTPLILLAEDNQANIDTMSGYLESRGYRLLLAKNGQQAIDFAQSQRPNLIVMDIQMPVMDGLEAMRRIREQPELLHVPIIALTALAMSGDRELCLAAGANEYLTKPVKLKQLAIAIQQLLAK